MLSAPGSQDTMLLGSINSRRACQAVSVLTFILVATPRFFPRENKVEIRLSKTIPNHPLEDPIVILHPKPNATTPERAITSKLEYPHLCDSARELNVSVLSFSNGQSHCDRNSILNVCYQDFPRDRIELLVAETSLTPSKVYTDAVRNPPCDGLRFTYRWYNASRRSPMLGALRVGLSKESTGDVLVNMDNDDFYHPLYVQTVLQAMACDQRPANAVFIHPHANQKINPDGTIAYSGMRKPGLGAHFTSMSKITAKTCPWGVVPFSEENALYKCLQKKNATIRHVEMTHNNGNSMLLVKFKSGMSITNQRFFTDREEYSRMNRLEWLSQFSWQAWKYEEFHELTRPRNIKPWWGNASAFKDLFDPKKAIGWKAFHLKHKDGFLSSKTLTEVACEGFASMPGQKFEDLKAAKEAIKVKDDKECCRHCQAKRGEGNSTCTAFEFRESTKNCVLFVVEGVRLPQNLIYAPSTLMEIHTYGLVDAYPKLKGFL